MTTRADVRIVPDDCVVVRVGEIVQRMKRGETQRQIAKSLGLSEGAVAKALRRAGSTTDRRFKES